jgi:hypothetical protein
MEITYQIVNSGTLGEAINIVGTNIHIPKDPNNKDYQEYLKWVAEGNTAPIVPAS